MHVHLVSAIFESSLRQYSLQETMETLLADGLMEKGVEVTTSGHALSRSWGHADVVHVHHLANACLRLPVTLGKKIVFTRHATKPIPFHHELVLKAAYARADAVVTLSRREYDQVKCDVPERKLHLIYNGTNVEHFPALLRKAPEEGDPWRLIYVGQLIELKRVEIAVRVLARLREAGRDAILSVVSHRPTLLSELTELASRLGVGDSLDYLGPKSRADLGCELARAHALVLPSRTEALPTVVAESVLSGLPVLAFDVGGIREQVPSTAILPAVSDFDGYLEAAQDLLSEYDRWAREYFRHSGRARERFSVTQMVQNHIDMYEGLLA